MDIELSIDDGLLPKAREHAHRLGKSVEQLLQDYLKQIGQDFDSEANAAEFSRLSRLSKGHSKGWKFNREEIHETALISPHAS
jgi:hypothetical protein